MNLLIKDQSEIESICTPTGEFRKTGIQKF